MKDTKRGEVEKLPKKKKKSRKKGRRDQKGLRKHGDRGQIEM